jgi:hypothetical protein
MMMPTIDAKEVVGEERSPSEDAKLIARHLIRSKTELNGLTIDVSLLAPEDLVSTFVNTLLHELEAVGVRLTSATSVKWKAKFPSEEARLEELVGYYVAGGSEKLQARH